MASFYTIFVDLAIANGKKRIIAQMIIIQLKIFYQSDEPELCNSGIVSA